MTRSLKAAEEACPDGYVIVPGGGECYWCQHNKDVARRAKETQAIAENYYYQYWRQIQARDKGLKRLTTKIKKLEAMLLASKYKP